MESYLYLGVFISFLLLFGEIRTENNDASASIRELIPLQAPENLTLLNFDERDVIIKWEAISPDTVRGTFRGYIVRVWNHGLSQVYAVPPDVTKTAVQFFPYSKNFITVSVRNDKYVGPRSEAISFDAPQTEPGMPFLFEQNQLGSRSALLQWSKPSNPNGILLGYNLYCSEAVDYGINEKTTVHEFIQGADNTQAKITGLKEGQKYQIDIAAINCAGEGEHNTLFVEVEPHQPYPPTTPSFKYKINYNITNKNDYFEKECSKPRFPYVPQTTMKIDMFDDDFYILNETDDNIITKTITEDSSEQAKTNDICVVKTLIKWIPDVDNNPGEYFYVKYRFKGSKQWTDTLPELSEDFIILDNFNACRSYEIILVAVDGQYKTESDVQETPVVVFA